MQILQWLFKLAKEGSRSEACSTIHNDSTLITTNPRTHPKDITRTETSRESKHGQRKGLRRGVWGFCKRDAVDEACFYGTLSLRRLRLNCPERRGRRWEELFRSISKAKQRTEEGVVSRRLDSDTIRILLPVTEATDLNLAGNLENGTRDRRKKEETSTKAKSAVSRMKELVRWAAATKTDKAVEFIYPKMKEESRGRQMKDEYEIMSLRMKRESYAAVGSTQQYHFGSYTYTRGNWITTDSEFVVLEL
ncbi:PREDICTED: uncharacterized protein LOC104804603 [Tarenaya hassleriana]|uniref:uncharacterized protein LOC104804603 n=1 Tax=Tarenaya hassleriana TaxID=28532 RepID=UPI00053C7B96|nr:PREDICTED: uncharacterized protein LOC104804603 [Tarenaya hassleriana]